MNHCPVYTRLGGHAYGTVYPGPIGSILEPQLQGLDVRGEMAEASSLCGACAEVCPVRIPIPTLINRLRQESVEVRARSQVAGRGSRRRRGEARLWALWAWIYSRPGPYRAFARLATALRALQPARLGPWTRTRTAPRLAPKDLHRLARELGIPRS
jgi:L-lactate dehydrogenase complex protein LldF